MQLLFDLINATISCQVPKKFTCKVSGKMGYEDFVHFILSEEDKSSEPGLEYWYIMFPVFDWMRWNKETSHSLLASLVKKGFKSTNMFFNSYFFFWNLSNKSLCDHPDLDDVSGELDIVTRALYQLVDFAKGPSTGLFFFFM